MRDRLAALALLLPTAALAQEMAGFGQTVSLGHVASTSQFGILASQANKTVTTRRRPAAALPQQTASLAFRASPQARKANYRQFVSKARKVDPVGAARMETLFGTTDIVAAMGAPLAKVGLRTDNVADAYTVWWMNAWQAAHCDTSDPSRAAIRAVRVQAATSILATPQFAGATDAMKQEFAEALLIQAALLEASADTYKSDPSMLAKLGAAVRQGAKASGLDLDAMRLTELGFVAG